MSKVVRVFILIFFLGSGILYAQDTDEPQRAFEWEHTIEIEETEDAFVVNPKIRVDGDRLIVADESQIRIYDLDGTLLMQMGEPGGEAPGALRFPAPAIQLSSGSYVVPDALTGNLSLFDQDGTFLDRHTRVVAPAGTHEVALLPGTDDVLMVGAAQVEGGGASPLLHRFNVEDGEVKQSFFPHPIPLGEYGGLLFTLGEISNVDIRNDRIAATFRVLPSLFIYDIDGELVERLDFPLQTFRNPKPDQLSSREEWFGFMLEHSFVTDVFWLTDDVLLLQFNDLEEFGEDGSVTNWRLAAVNLDGDVLFEWIDTPRLFGIHPETRKMYFQDPDAEVPNRLKVGQFSESVLQDLSL